MWQSWHFWLMTGVTACCVWLSAPDRSDAQKLSAIKAAASGDSKPASSSSNDHDHDCRKRRQRHDHHCGPDCDECSSSAFSEFTGDVLLTALSSPFVVPRALVGDTDFADVEFPALPYSDEGASPFDGIFETGDSSQIIFRGQYGDDFSGLSNASGRLLWDSSWRLGIDTEFFYRREELSQGSDELWNGDFNVVYTFARSEDAQFRVGAGVNWLTDRSDTFSGFNFTYGAVFFPAEPFVISADLDWGNVGEASLFHGRTTIGVTHNGWGLFTGYDYLKIEDVDVHAWINGVELRF
ncbi:MAG: hypothetical protein ACYTGL_29620 [Planctomycetota bacterium]|jgi:hypothetical protein